MKRDPFLTLFLALLMSGLGLSQARPPLVDEMGFADSILVNGKIVSMDDRTTVPDTPGHIFEARGMDFWTPIYSLITRRIPRTGIFGNVKGREDIVLLPEEAIDRVSALKMATTWASEYMLAEDTIGTLEAGKYADFAVLEKDFFQHPGGRNPRRHPRRNDRPGRPNHL